VRSSGPLGNPEQGRKLSVALTIVLPEPLERLEVHALDQPRAWVVASVSGHKTSLTEPAGVKGAEKRVLLASVSVLDLTDLDGFLAAAVA